MTSCLFILATFLHDHHTGFPGVRNGWVLTDKSYTYRTTWIWIGKNHPGKSLKKIDECLDNGTILNVYEAH